MAPADVLSTANNTANNTATESKTSRRNRRTGPPNCSSWLSCLSGCGHRSRQSLLDPCSLRTMLHLHRRWEWRARCGLDAQTPFGTCGSHRADVRADRGGRPSHFLHRSPIDARPVLRELSQRARQDGRPHARHARCRPRGGARRGMGSRRAEAARRGDAPGRRAAARPGGARRPGRVAGIDARSRRRGQAEPRPSGAPPVEPRRVCERDS